MSNSQISNIVWSVYGVYGGPRTVKCIGQLDDEDNRPIAWSSSSVT